MPEVPYCPLLSIGKDVPVLCQEELCMWYVKQLKLCSLTVMAYSQALELQTPSAGAQTQQVQKSQSSTQSQTKPGVPQSVKKEVQKTNPFVLDDLD